MYNFAFLAVAGNPILHSKSPNIFEQVMPRHCRYLRISATDAKEAMYLFKSLNLDGMNVTAPFKESIIEYVDVLDDTVKAIGTVNTIVKNHGKLYGYNTDVQGVLSSLTEHDVGITGKNCLVLGAGGAGKAAAYALKIAGGNVTVVNRTLKRAQDLSEKFEVNFKPIEELSKVVKDSEIIISTITAGSQILTKRMIKKHHIVMDAVYYDSKIDKIATAAGATFIDGSNWLVNQAATAYGLFYGANPVREQMFGSIYKPNSPFKGTVSLVGFMGAGKSTVAKALAKKVKINCIDTDELIEKQAGKSVSEIFENEGETEFRKIESDVIENINYSLPAIIACGGGAVVNSKNIDKITENSIVVWLYSSIDETMDRISDYSRPLLDVEEPKLKAEVMLSNRKHFYAVACDYVCCVDGKSVEEIVEGIYGEISKTFKGSWSN